MTASSTAKAFDDSVACAFSEACVSIARHDALLRTTPTQVLFDAAARADAHVATYYPEVAGTSRALAANVHFGQAVLPAVRETFAWIDSMEPEAQAVYAHTLKGAMNEVLVQARFPSQTFAPKPA